MKQIEQIHAESWETYGSPRTHAELTLGLWLSVNLKRVARLMRQAGVQGLYRRRRRGCTVCDPDAQPSPDPVNRNFIVTEPNRLWVTDITEHPTQEGILYCAAVMDAYSRLIVGWRHCRRTELVTDALGMASSDANLINKPAANGRYCTLTTVLNTLLRLSVNASALPGYLPLWALSVTVTTIL